MAYLEDRPNDIFVSYAHDDDVSTKWVFKFTRFLANELNKQLKHKDPEHRSKVKIWKDEQLPQQGSLRRRLDEVLSQSSILLVCMSRGYLDSRVCGQELESFNRAFGDASESRIFMIELEDTSDQQWPEELMGEDGHPYLAHCFFETKADDTTGPIRLIDRQGGLDFQANDEIVKFGSHLADTLRLMRRGEFFGTTPDRPKVYLAVSDQTLATRRQELARLLETNGLDVVPAKIPTQLDKIKVNCRLALESCRTYVQLLNKWDGMWGTTEEYGFVGDQLEEALNQGVDLLLWDDPDLSVLTTANKNFKELADRVRQDLKGGELEQFAIAVATKVREQIPPQPVGDGKNWWLEVRCLPKDRKYADFVEQAMRDASRRMGTANTYGVLRPSPGDTAADRAFMEKEANGVVIVWGEAGFPWAKREIDLGLNAQRSYGKPPAVAVFNPLPKPHITAPNLFRMDLHEETKAEAVAVITRFLTKLNADLEAKGVTP